MYNIFLAVLMHLIPTLSYTSCFYFRLLRSFAIIFYIRISHLCLCFYCFFSICHQKETMLQLRKAFVTIYVKNMDIDKISCISQEQSNKCHIVCSFIGRKKIEQQCFQQFSCILLSTQTLVLRMRKNMKSLLTNQQKRLTINVYPPVNVIIHILFLPLILFVI